MKTITAKEVNGISHENRYNDIFEAIEKSANDGYFGAWATFVYDSDDERKKCENLFKALGFKIEFDKECDHTLNIHVSWRDKDINDEKEKTK